MELGQEERVGFSWGGRKGPGEGRNVMPFGVYSLPIQTVVIPLGDPSHGAGLLVLEVNKLYIILKNYIYISVRIITSADLHFKIRLGMHFPPRYTC